jgi:hypothetical protein
MRRWTDAVRMMPRPGLGVRAEAGFQEVEEERVFGWGE